MAGSKSYKPAKTNAARELDRLGLVYELRNYEVDLNDLSAEAVAAKTDIPLEQVFKTLLLRGDCNGVCFAVVPGNAQLDEKALARITGDRKISMVALSEVEILTGYVRGGVTALAGKHRYPVYLDETAILWESISVSAGVRGLQIVLSPDSYMQAVNPVVAAIARQESNT